MEKTSAESARLPKSLFTPSFTNTKKERRTSRMNKLREYKQMEERKRKFKNDKGKRQKIWLKGEREADEEKIKLTNKSEDKSKVNQ